MSDPIRIKLCDCEIDSSLEQQFEKISEIANEIDDESNDQDWYSLTLGWALAKGLTPIKAHEFAKHIRYHTTLG
jgi:hypothetical protein